MYKVLWNHLDQNLKKAPAPAVFLALLTAGWSVAGILAGLLGCLELQTERMVKLTVILCAGGYAGLILGFFGISVGVLRCAGGIVLFAAGWSALNAPSHEASKATAPQNLPRSRLKAMAFFPFTLPLTTGPGAIAVSVALGTSLPFNVANIAGTIIAIIATVIVIWLCYRYSDRVSKAVGAAGADALARIFAFILICLGVSIFWQGFSELWLALNAQ